MNAKLRKEVWNKYDQRCAYCGIELKYKQLQVDHIKAVNRPVAYTETYKKSDRYKAELKSHRQMIKQYESIEFLNPACRSCNIDKHSMTLDHWRAAIQNKIECLKRVPNFRFMLRYGQVKITEKPVMFYYESERVSRNV